MDIFIKMPDVPSRDEVQNLSLDEYFRMYVQNKPVMRKRSTYPYPGPCPGPYGPGSYSGRYPSQAQQRRRYERSHYFAPEYQRQQQEQQQKLLKQQKNPQQQHQQPESMFMDLDVLNNLRQEMELLRKQCVSEYRQLEHRLGVQRAEGIQEMRRLLERHHYARHTLQMRIHDAERIYRQRDIYDQSMMQLRDQQQKLQQEQQKKAAESLEINNNDVPGTPEHELLKPPRLKSPELPHWYISTTHAKEDPKGAKDSKFKLDDVDFGGTGISTKEVIAEIQEEMEDDINSDMLYIPTNFSLHE
ncbi:PREDICTED: putative transcriptional regulator cudA [Drosophila arizonae]|uniref:Transcriptional regulator cudA n=1 Tax=Drosophila arizonae TaxID=7263 RepID=A0ABM1PT25_DROAR|nr:PREDICTED: putative transcriptional regulator cudA [Drosophila arizonae]